MAKTKNTALQDQIISPIRDIKEKKSGWWQK